jgi:hypothetical protein
MPLLLGEEGSSPSPWFGAVCLLGVLALSPQAGSGALTHLHFHCFFFVYKTIPTSFHILWPLGHHLVYESSCWALKEDNLMRRHICSRMALHSKCHQNTMALASIASIPRQEILPAWWGQSHSDPGKDWSWYEITTGVSL